MRILERLRLQGRLPQRIKVDNGPEVSGNALDTWAFEHGVQIEFTVQGSPQIMDTLKALTENSEMSA